MDFKKLSKAFLGIVVLFASLNLFAQTQLSFAANPPPACTGGLVPCGRNCDDPATPINEEAPCTLCALVFMMQTIIDFLVKISAAFAVLAIALGGFMYIFAAGDQGRIGTAKSIIKYALLGFLVVFIAWAIVESILVLLGYIDPIAGDWYIVC